MKRIFAILTVISFVSLSAMAQEEQVKAEQNYERTGKYSVEANFDPANIFEHSSSSMFSMPSFKLRVFKSENSAYRLRFLINYSTSKDEQGTESNYTKSSSLYLMVAPGYEKHFGQGRLKPYWGFEVPISYKTTNSETRYGDVTGKIKNEDNDGYFSFGLNGVFGLDFYLYKNIFIGAEFTPGLGFKKAFDEEVESVVTEKGGNSFSFNTSSYSGLKIGYRF